MRSALRVAFACSIFAVGACRYRPTQITLLLDSNVSASRPQTLTITSLRGERSLAELSTASMVTRITNASAAIFPGSVAIVPRQGQPRSDVTSVLAVLDVPAQGAQPALRIERLQRLRLIEQIPQQGRMFFNAQCAGPSSGCSSVAASECTVARRCIDQGLTCGDDGTCVPLELPVVIVPPETPLDATVIDARAPTTDAAVPDALDASADSGVRLSAHLYRPMSTSTVTTTRPRLVWNPPFRGATSRVLLCRNRAMTDRCRPIVETAIEEVTIASDLAPGVWFWRVSSASNATPLQDSPVWQFRVRARDVATTNASFGVEPDFNGDGFADAVVGAPGVTSSVWVIKGSAAGFANETPLVITTSLARFGGSVASAGDLNGDGFAELVVGAPDAGAVRVYWGGPSGLDAMRFSELRSDPQSSFGDAVAGAGDLNGDGYGDLLVGAHLASPGGRGAAGTATVFFGAADGVSDARKQVLEGALAGDWFGFSVAGALNTDGSIEAQIAVGAYGADVGGMTNVGSVSVFSGRASGVTPAPTRTYAGATANAEYGWSVANAGDVNGDGRSDLLVGSPWVDVGGRQDAGQVHVFLTGATGLGTVPAHEFNQAGVNEYLGWSVAGAGDTNGDGFDDVVLGAKGFAMIPGFAPEGRATVFLGASSGLGANPVSVLVGRGQGAEQGSAVGSACDVNGDGFAEVIVGARNELVAGQMAAGTASVFVGAVNGPRTTALRVFEGMTASEWLGGSVASRALRASRAWRSCAVRR